MPSQPSSFSIALPYKKFIITLDIQTDNAISNFPSSTIRGGLGYALKSCVCSFHGKNCIDCILKHSCIYPFLFESIPHPGASRLKKYESIPRPFTLYAQQEKNTLLLELTLFGEAIKSIPYFIFALDKLHERGLGKDKKKPVITSVTTDNNRVIYPLKDGELDQNFQADTIIINEGPSSSGSMEIIFKTPFIIRTNGIAAGTFDKRSFFTTLIRRITNLNAFYGQNKNASFDVKSVIKGIADIDVKTNLKKHSASRFSTKQKQRLDYSGLIGDIKISGNIGPLLPFLKAGEITGVGKNTVFGYGKYEIN